MFTFFEKNKMRVVATATCRVTCENLLGARWDTVENFVLKENAYGKRRVDGDRSMVKQSPGLSRWLAGGELPDFVEPI